jgi:hypothetical protein
MLCDGVLYLLAKTGSKRNGDPIFGKVIKYSSWIYLDFRSRGRRIGCLPAMFRREVKYAGDVTDYEWDVVRQWPNGERWDDSLIVSTDMSCRRRIC